MRSQTRIIPVVVLLALVVILILTRLAPKFDPGGLRDGPGPPSYERIIRGLSALSVHERFKGGFKQFDFLCDGARMWMSRKYEGPRELNVVAYGHAIDRVQNLSAIVDGHG